MEKTLTIHEGSREHSTLVNALRVAADRFKENSETMQKVHDAGGNGFIGPNQAMALADDFKQQRKDTLRLLEYFDNMQEYFKVTSEIEDEDDED